MQLEEYVGARRGRLIDHAVALGTDPADAAPLVDGVLAERRRRIERLVDPDPELYPAVERAVDLALHGPPPAPRARQAALASIVVLALVAGGAWWLLRPAEQVRVPSFLGLPAAQVSAWLAAADLVGERDVVPTCAPPGLVVGTDPPANRTVDAGSTVRLLVAASPGDSCGSAQVRQDRADAWAFVGFVRGGPAPAFDDTVYVVLAGREPAVLPAAAAADPKRWAGIDSVREDVAALTATGTAYPRLRVRSGTPPRHTCGFPQPAGAGDRAALRFTIEPGDGRDVDCPLRVDLYRDASGVIDAVVVHPADEAIYTFETTTGELVKPPESAFGPQDFIATP